MPIMDNPEVPPAVYVQIDRDVDAIRPIGPIKVTVTSCGGRWIPRRLPLVRCPLGTNRYRFAYARGWRQYDLRSLQRG